MVQSSMHMYLVRLNGRLPLVNCIHNQRRHCDLDTTKPSKHFRISVQRMKYGQELQILVDDDRNAKSNRQMSMDVENRFANYHSNSNDSIGYEWPNNYLMVLSP